MTQKFERTVRINNKGTKNRGIYCGNRIAFFDSLVPRHPTGHRRSQRGSHFLNGFGNAYNNLGQYPKAVEFYQQSLAIQKDIGERQGEALSLNNLGGAYISLKQYIEYSVIFARAIFIWIIQPNGEIKFRSVNLPKDTSLEELVKTSRLSIGVKDSNSNE